MLLDTRTQADPFVLGGKEFTSRLIVGTGKYATMELMAEAIEASGAEIVTVAVRRSSVADPSQPRLFDHLDRGKYLILPNTAGCTTADEAIRYARLGREVGLSDWIKLEVIGDPKTLFPDVAETLRAAEVLLAEGFTVLPYVNDDPVACRKLEAMGCAAVMPLAAPIGSGLGIRNPANLRIIREFASVPMIVDAGVGTASDAAVAMELGADAVLMNTGIAGAKDPVGMATAMNYAVRAGRLARLSGRIERKLYATASSPLSGMID
ncbi:MAG TPA: thiazole synthase [Thermoanaerobaculia bacterium]|nr:thiazole synthase [Thermoanaerobaculia bacterium]